MLQRKANTYRLYPTPEQTQKMTEFAGACRLVYNLALEQRSKWWKPGRTFNFTSQCLEVTQLRAEFPWMKEVPSQTLQQALKDLDKAYSRFFKGISGYPTPRKKFRQDSFRFPEPKSLELKRTGKSSGQIKLPKLGWVNFRGWYDVPGDFRSATVSLRAGQWHVAVQWQHEIEDVPVSNKPAVGIDMGITVFASLSDGTSIESANFGKKAMKALKKAQRALSRKQKGSNNRKKALKKVQKLHLKVKNSRKDFIEKASTAIANNHGVVYMEALKMRNMTKTAKGTKERPGKRVRQKSGLNRSILDQGWGMFRMMLERKLSERGGVLLLVNPAYTSQTCSVCGVVDAKSRVTQARFVCTGCGHEANADTNASLNILRRGQDMSLKRVDGTLANEPVETRSIEEVARENLRFS